MTLDSKQQSILDNLLLEAVQNKDLARAKTYVAKGANVHVAVDTTQTIWRDGMTYRSSGTAPLYHHLYESCFSYEMSDFFLSQGVSVEVKNFNGNTPLMLAVKGSQASLVKYYLSKGANPLATNKAGEIVLEEARKLPSSSSARQGIIDALVDALAAPPKPEPAQAPVPAPETPKADEVETARDIQPLKPIEFAALRKPAGGFNL